MGKVHLEYMQPLATTQRAFGASAFPLVVVWGK